MSHDNHIPNPVEYMSERKIKPINRGTHLDPLGIERQKCWQSPHGASSVSDNDSGVVLPENDFVQNNGVTNIMTQEGG